MAEAEDLIIDAARHATIFARNLWLRHRRPDGRHALALTDITQRLHLLTAAVFGNVPPVRPAQPPAPATFLQRLANRHGGPFHEQALPATDGHILWLPRELGIADAALALERYRTLSLQQAMRAKRGGALLAATPITPLERDLFLLLEAAAADLALAQLLPGMKAPLERLRRAALAQRPALDSFPPPRRPLEALVRALLASDCDLPPTGLGLESAPAGMLAQARDLARTLECAGQQEPRGGFLFKDLWTGEFRLGADQHAGLFDGDAPGDDDNLRPPRSARLARRPEVRQPTPDEDDAQQGAWMVQTAQPHEHAEDPVGMQRPTDRDETAAAEEFAESLSELPEARLVSTPGRPKEVLLSDDAPDLRGKRNASPAARATGGIAYPEWDYRARAYRNPGATVRLLPPQPGPQEWVAATLREHRAMLQAIRRRFDMLRAHRIRLRKQFDGEDIDLDAYIDGYADFHAGQPMPQALYQTARPARRDMAISLLIDISGSTDGWIAAHRRIIDVEREALLLVCIALDGMAQLYAVLAFSGEGPANVTLRSIKDFSEPYRDEVACRIAGLEPEHYTRAGAAIRHATATLMRQPAHHRLLLLLSDGKPNDIDQYEGRYGLEDMRQAVIEAQLQGISLFCLTIDRHAAAYLPQVFGARRYALLPRPELLPTVLLDWIKRLMTV
ncbi:MAG TPA: VWA domain-containing protein [Paucimonas sp.]|nr:VWA domain-containing protein [Paucimonas sp.]HJW54345.1 VWA domain-containing protein [Burkholderiaceae bacterium]